MSRCRSRWNSTPKAVSTFFALDPGEGHEYRVSGIDGRVVDNLIWLLVHFGFSEKQISGKIGTM